MSRRYNWEGRAHGLAKQKFLLKSTNSVWPGLLESKEGRKRKKSGKWLHHIIRGNIWRCGHAVLIKMGEEALGHRKQWGAGCREELHELLSTWCALLRASLSFVVVVVVLWCWLQMHTTFLGFRASKYQMWYQNWEYLYLYTILCLWEKLLPFKIFFFLAREENISFD